MSNQPTDDVWILYDTGSLAKVCPRGFQEELGMRKEWSPFEAATGNALTLGGAREVPVEIADANVSFGFGVANLTKRSRSAEGLLQAVYTCDLQDWWVLRRHSQRSDDRERIG